VFLIQKNVLAPVLIQAQQQRLKQQVQQQAGSSSEEELHESEDADDDGRMIDLGNGQMAAADDFEEDDIQSDSDNDEGVKMLIENDKALQGSPLCNVSCHSTHAVVRHDSCSWCSCRSCSVFRTAVSCLVVQAGQHDGMSYLAVSPNA
jgi:hypothetical protein